MILDSGITKGPADPAVRGGGGGGGGHNFRGAQNHRSNVGQFGKTKLNLTKLLAKPRILL